MGANGGVQLVTKWGSSTRAEGSEVDRVGGPVGGPGLEYA